MVVLTLTDCPVSLRGDLTKWLQEISTGVFVGNVSARVRDELWNRVKQNAKNGRATLVFSANNEQRMDFRVHNTSWEPIDFDGVKLILRPSPARIKKLGSLRQGFSNASKQRKVKQLSRNSAALLSLPNSYVVIDIETTGLNIKTDTIIEIGALLIMDGRVESEYEALIMTERTIPVEIQRLTGIDNDILQKEGRDLNKALQELVAFAQDYPLVSHNIEFDHGFLCAALEKSALPELSNEYIDTLVLSRRLARGLPDYKLGSMLAHFDIVPNGMHRSSYDCQSTHELYQKLRVQQSDARR